MEEELSYPSRLLLRLPLLRREEEEKEKKEEVLLLLHRGTGVNLSDAPPHSQGATARRPTMIGAPPSPHNSQSMSGNALSKLPA